MGFLKILKILFAKMHLWLPISYVVIFLIISAVNDIVPINLVAFFIGLSFSILGALGLVYLGKWLEKKKTQEKKPEQQQQADESYAQYQIGRAHV